VARGLLAGILGRVPEPSRESVIAVVNAVRRDPPVALARFAPLVCQAAAAGDPIAGDIITRAAGHLIDSATLVRAADPTSPLVLAGGLLVGDTPLSTEVRARAARRWPQAQVTLAGDGAAAAAWLAALSLPNPPPATNLHTKLVIPG
jgi:N-acetylglucosamine kinase-like BadF-type ATPase